MNYFLFNFFYTPLGGYKNKLRKNYKYIHINRYGDIKITLHTTQLMQRDIFKSEVSVFPCGWKRKDMHVVWTIDQFIAAGKHYETDIEKARSIMNDAMIEWEKGNEFSYEVLMQQYKDIKSKLPSALMQGVNQEHNNDVQQFQSFTDVLCIDIDAPKPDQPKNGNEWIPHNLDKLKQLFSKIPFIAYCGLSVGGKGLFLLIPIADHTHHRDYWQQIRTMFKEKFKIEIDAVTYNMGRLRTLSYDATAFINHDAMVWEKLPEPQPKPQPKRVFNYTATYNTSEDEERIVKLANEIALRGIDITPSYGEWQQVAASIAHTMGERGRMVFHMIASQSEKYNQQENDRLFTSMLQPSAGRECTANTFFYICDRYGLKIKPSKRARYGPYDAQRTTSTHTSVEEVRTTNTIDTQIGLPSSLVDAAEMILNSSTSGMSKAEAMELQRNWKRMEEDTKGLAFARERVPALDLLCNKFDLHYNGNKEWHMTNSQFSAYNDLIIK